MHAQDTATAAAQALQTYFDTGYLGHAANLAAVVQEWLPNGELTWLGPSGDRAESDDALYVPPRARRELVARERASHTRLGPDGGSADVVTRSRGPGT